MLVILTKFQWRMHFEFHYFVRFQGRDLALFAKPQPHASTTQAQTHGTNWKTFEMLFTPMHKPIGPTLGNKGGRG